MVKKKKSRKTTKHIRPPPKPRQKKEFPAYYLFFLVISLVVLLDQLTKLQIESNLLPNSNQFIIESVLSISYIKNSGAAFGFLQGSAAILVWVTIAILAGIIYYYPKFSGSHHSVLAVALISGGLIGNLVDRSLFGYVVDFIDFGFWPAFNIADAAVTLGVFALIFYLSKNEI